jgi:hypothetical protein
MLITIKNALCLCMMATGPVAAKKQILFLDDDKTLDVKVSDTGMTRLSFEGDRIQDVLGLEEGVATERDEKGGQLFIKSLQTRQNLTLITEGGNMQDVTLIPAKINSGSVTFKNKESQRPSIDSPAPHWPDFKSPFPEINVPKDRRFQSGNCQDTIIALVKAIFVGEGESLPQHHDLDETPNGLKPVYVRSLTHGDMRADLYDITNTTDTVQHLCEKNFLKPESVSVAIGCRQLPKNQRTVIIIVSKIASPKGTD